MSTEKSLRQKHDEAYVAAWDRQGQLLDGLLERDSQGGYEGYATPHSARGQRLRAKYAAQKRS